MIPSPRPLMMTMMSNSDVLERAYTMFNAGLISAAGLNALMMRLGVEQSDVASAQLGDQAEDEDPRALENDTSLQARWLPVIGRDNLHRIPPGGGPAPAATLAAAAQSSAHENDAALGFGLRAQPIEHTPPMPATGMPDWTHHFLRGIQGLANASRNSLSNTVVPVCVLQDALPNTCRYWCPHGGFVLDR